jgi:hypothetical protein
MAKTRVPNVYKRFVVYEIQSHNTMIWKRSFETREEAENYCIDFFEKKELQTQRSFELGLVIQEVYINK